MLRFEVVDTGIGVPHDVRDKLFTRFTQGDPLAARKYPGTGLGLAITKRLAELMGGTVGLHSEVGKGSTFWFTVECELGHPSTESVAPALRSEHGRFRPLHVLVAEDNDVNRYLMVSILERLRHGVVAVVNGREAVEAAQREQFDLILMDVQMPVANGIDATRAIRALPGRPGRVPILAVTANVLPEQQAVYRREGFSGWVPKPLTLEQVEIAIGATVPPTPGAARSSGPTTPRTAVATRDAVRSGAVFDSALIEQYRSVLGERGATQMVELFVQTLAERTVELQAAIAGGDIDEINRVGHTIKGMAAAIGAVSLSECGLDLQDAIADQVPAAHARFVREAAAAAAGVRDAWKLPVL